MRSRTLMPGTEHPRQDRKPLRAWWGVLALLLVAFAAVRGSAQGTPTAGPLISAEEMLSVDQLQPGMKGQGKSVFQGTKIETFNVTLIGVLRKIDFGGDMILIRIDDGPPVTGGSGVSAGMSGSPIYVKGKLIGALAFSWPFAREPIAGVTPIAQMLENYRPGSAPPPPTSVARGDLAPEGGPLRLDGRLFARATVVPERSLAPAAASAGSTLYLAPVATPVLVSGMGGQGLETLRKRLGQGGAVVAPGPGKTELPVVERPKIEPGSAVGVELLGGDIDATAIGTVTYVKDGHVLAFGHPFQSLGGIEMPMTTAYIHGIISSQESSFKLGSPVETVGRVTQDRNWSIGGRMGEMPRTVAAEYEISDADRGVLRSYRVQAAVQRDLTPELLYGALVSAIGSISPPTTGTTRGTFDIYPRGLPPIHRENVTATGERRSQLEQLFGDPTAGQPLVEVLQTLELLENNPYGPAPVERLKVSVEVTEKRRTAFIERAYADRKRVRPGETVKVGVVMRPVDGARETREFELTIPQNIPGGRLSIGVAGGGNAERMRQMLQVQRPPARSLGQLVEQLTGRERNNDLTLEMAQPVVGVAVGGREFPNLPNLVVEVLSAAGTSGIRVARGHTRFTQETPYVLRGSQLLSLQVDAEEKDKTGSTPTTGFGSLGSFGSLFDLLRLGFGSDTGGDWGDGDGADSDDGAVSGDEDGPLGAAARAARRAAPRNPTLPGDALEDPKEPSFEELQRILDGGDSASPLEPGEAGPATTLRKGLARAPGVWRMRTSKDFAGGKLEGVLVSSRGELALAPPATPLLTAPERFFWAQASDGAGNLYVGGWLEGTVEKIGADGKTSRFFEAPGEIAVTALATGVDGSLYVAAAPSGTIYRVDAAGKGVPFCRLPDQRIWALRQVGDALYAGTGPEGRLYRIGSNGAATVAFTAPDRHVFALTDDGKGALYCGTYPRGKIFRVREGKTEPVHELPASTVTALACDGQGNLFVGTSPKASIVKITPAGEVSTLFQSTERHVLSLVTDEAGNAYAAVGSPARVYRIAPDRTASTLWDPQAGYVLALSRDRTGNLYATTAGPTRVVRLGAGGAMEAGGYTSRVLNAGNLAKWGVVRWAGAAGTGVELRTRTGNTAYPDATWTDWSAPVTQPTGTPIASAPGQYLQYQVRLSPGGNAPPTVRNLELFYRPRNRAPEVNVVSPVQGDLLSGTRAITWKATDPDRDRLSADIFYQREGTTQWTKIGSLNADAPDEDASDPTSVQRLEDGGNAPLPTLISRGASPRLPKGRMPAGARTAATPRRPLPGQRPPVRRSTENPLEAALAAAGVDASSLTTGADGALTLSNTDTALDLGGENPTLNWNTRKTPDGRYRLKVVVTDRASCPDDPATAEAISELMIVDNTGPQVALAKRADLSPPETIHVRDEGGYVAGAEYRVDAGEWRAAAAADGIFDSPEEAVKLDIGALPAGKHTLELRVRDAAGNEATQKLPYQKGGATVSPGLPSAPPSGAGKPAKPVPSRRRTGIKLRR